MSREGRGAIPKQCQERSYLWYIYITLRLVSFLFENDAIMQLAFQFWLIFANLFATANLNGTDVARGCNILLRRGTNCGGSFISYINHESGQHEFCWCVYENSLAFGVRGFGKIHKNEKVYYREFDSTRGFPGEGPQSWSNSHPYLTFGTWNTRILTFERFEY